MLAMLTRVLLIAVAIFVLVSALRYRILRRPLTHGFFKDGEVGIDVAGVERTHKVAEDTLSTAMRSSNGKIATTLDIRNDGSMATKYSFTTGLKSGSPEAFERLNLNITDADGNVRWQGPVKDLGYKGHFHSILPVQEEEELHMELSQTDPNIQSDVEVEFALYANPLGTDIIPDEHYHEIIAPGHWQDLHPKEPE